MLRISRLADYGTVILTYMAKAPQVRVSAPNIAQATHLSAPMVSKILKILAHANLLVSTRGVKGGYMLARAPGQITVIDVITTLDGEMALTACTGVEQDCDLKDICHIRANWQVINSAIYRALGSITLADMITPLPANQFIDANTIPIRRSAKDKR